MFVLVNLSLKNYPIALTLAGFHWDPQSVVSSQSTPWPVPRSHSCQFSSWHHFITLQASLIAQSVNNLPAVQETWVPTLGWGIHLRIYPFTSPFPYLTCDTDFFYILITHTCRQYAFYLLSITSNLWLSFFKYNLFWSLVFFLGSPFFYNLTCSWFPFKPSTEK